MKVTPALMNAEMVLATLGGRKTQTRRIVTPQPEHVELVPTLIGRSLYLHGKEIKCPFGSVGDLIYVRETIMHGGYEGASLAYCADGKQSNHIWPSHWKGHCRPSIHMPRWASRITLKIIKVRAEKLQDISGMDADAEGSPIRGCAFPRKNHIIIDAFAELWEAINGQGSWAKNPWVWAIEFEVNEINIDDYLEKIKA